MIRRDRAPPRTPFWGLQRNRRPSLKSGPPQYFSHVLLVPFLPHSHLKPSNDFCYQLVHRRRSSRHPNWQHRFAWLQRAPQVHWRPRQVRSFRRYANSRSSVRHSPTHGFARGAQRRRAPQGARRHRFVSSSTSLAPPLTSRSSFGTWRGLLQEPGDQHRAAEEGEILHKALVTIETNGGHRSLETNSAASLVVLPTRPSTFTRLSAAPSFPMMSPSLPRVASPTTTRFGTCTPASRREGGTRSLSPSSSHKKVLF